MYDPLVGRFLEGDPIDFAAGDPNLFRYVHNSPTNATDPSGLAEVITVTDSPQKEDVADRQTWEVRLGTGGRSTLIDTPVRGMQVKGTLSASISGANLLEGGKRHGATGGIAIWYKGDRAKDVRFIQFERIDRGELVYSYWATKKDACPDNKTSTFFIEHQHDLASPVIKSSSEKEPLWYIDTFSTKSPWYLARNAKGQRGVGGVSELGATISWMYDTPSVAAHEANEELTKAVLRLFDRLPQNLNTVRVTVKVEFQTYAVLDGDFIGHVSWENVGQAVWTNGKGFASKDDPEGKIFPANSIQIWKVDTTGPTVEMMKALEAGYGKDWAAK